MSEYIIRLAKEEDSTAILEIYAPFIRDTVVTFEYEVPSISEFAERISSISKKHPWLVCETDGKVIGYAYASKHAERAAYQWSVNVSVYICPDYHGKHIATALYTALFDLLKMMGYCSAYAGITTPNVKSEGFHQAFGFKPVGTFKNVGFKLGKWNDVGWFQCRINDLVQTPQPPKSIHEITAENDFEKIFKRTEAMIK